MPKMLHTWNVVDGFDGWPVRRIDTRGLTSSQSSLLERACIAGGEGWASGCPERSVLCVVLQASRAPNSPDLYDLFFEHYRESELASQFQARVEALSGLDRGLWECQLNCAGWDDAQIDATIVQIVQWHAAEIARIKTLRDRVA